MQDFINMATKQLGISEGAAKQGTGALLGMVQQQLGGGEFSKLTSMLPGAQQLMGGGGSSTGGIAGALGGLMGGKSGGGGLGALASAASGLLGKDAGGLGQIAGLVSQLSNAGISTDKAGGFVKLFMDYVSGKGGGDIVTKLLGNADLKKLIG